MRVIVSGAVAWINAESIRRELSRLPADSTVIHGDSPGVDTLAGQIAAELGLPVLAFAKEKQDYEKYQRAAWKGLNERMLAGGAALVLAFHPDIEMGHGTRHLAEIARAAGVEVRAFTE